MKKVLLIFFITIAFISCSNDDDKNNVTFESTGKIIGLDVAQCVCGCGGYIIEINGKNDSFRYFEEFPNNNLDLSIENLPLEVKLNWELIDQCKNITITQIEEL